jgi:hypothetical protein
MIGGGGNQTVGFSAAADSAIFTGHFGTGFINLGAGDDTMTFAGTAISGTTITGTDNSDSVLFTGLLNSVVFNSAIGTGALISFGSGLDQATFNGNINAASIYGGGGADSLDFNNGVITGASFQGGAGVDVFQGAISVASSGVSFWGGVGGDSFGFDHISNGAGTAYFWNDAAGTDTIVFDATAATNTTNFGFGVSVASALDFKLNAAYTTSFSAAGISNSYQLAGSSNLATAIFGTTDKTVITLDFADGTSLIFNGGQAAFTTAFATGFGVTLSNVAVGGANATLNFGTASTTLPTFS